MKTITLFVAIIFTTALSAQWIKTSGPPGITVTKFLDTDTILYVGTSAHGVYKSYDHGLTWSAANSGIENKEVLSLAGDSLFLYAGTGDEGVFRSSDNGGSWVAANDSIQTLAIYCMLNAGGYLFAGTIGTGVYRSADHGNSWHDVNGGALNSSFIYTMVYSNSRLTVEADNYLFYSLTLGGNWFVDQGTTSFYVVNNILQKGDTLVASAKYGNVFFSADGGVEWDTVVSVDPDIEILGLDRIGNTIYAGYAMGVYESNDWGQTWTPTPSTGLRVGDRLFNGDFEISGPYFLLSFEEIGIYYSENQGLTWTQAIDGFEPASNIDNCMIVIDNKLISGTHTDGVYASPDQGDSWTKLGSNSPLDTLSNAIIFSMLSPARHILLAGGCGDGLYRSDDDGDTWAHITNGLPVQQFNGYTCINSLAYADNNVVAATTEGIYYSSDLGVTWHNTNISDPDIYTSGLAANGNVLCTGVVAFNIPGGIYRSTDAGVSWSLTSSILDIITVASDGNHHFYGGTLFDSYFSDDNGVSWQGVGPGIKPGAGGFAILAIDSHVIVGNRDGIYYSEDFGATFDDEIVGLPDYPNHSVQGLTYDSTYVYAGLFRNAIWRRPLSDFEIILPRDTIVDTTSSGIFVEREMDMQLSNSADGSILIRGNIEQGMQLELYDILGRRMFSEKILTPTIDISTLQKGMYLWQITRGEKYLAGGKIRME